MRAFIVTLLAALCLASSGCAGLVALQAAGYAKTVYDYRDVYMPEQRVNHSGAQIADRNVENAIMERLETEGLTEVAVVEPTAISGHVYLVGAFADRTTAERAREITRATPGVHRLTCSFVLADPAKADSESSREAARSIRSRLADFEEPLPAVRVSVLYDNAVLMGFVPSGDHKRQVESLAWNTEGVRDVRSYIDVRQ